VHCIESCTENDFRKPDLATIARELNRGVAAGTIRRLGTGRKNDPFRYWLPGKEEDLALDPDASRQEQLDWAQRQSDKHMEALRRKHCSGTEEEGSSTKSHESQATAVQTPLTASASSQNPLAPVSQYETQLNPSQDPRVSASATPLNAELPATAAAEAREPAMHEPAPMTPSKPQRSTKPKAAPKPRKPAATQPRPSGDVPPPSPPAAGCPRGSDHSAVNRSSRA
jgi:hypothetical protein